LIAYRAFRSDGETARLSIFRLPIENSLSKACVMCKPAITAPRIGSRTFKGHLSDTAIRRFGREPDREQVIGHGKHDVRRETIENLVNLGRN
jgi:hypothetical protein